MPTYVALLRAVNVGGRKLPMAELRGVLGEAGYSEVATYIQSGNIVLRSPIRDRGKLESALDKLILSRFALAVDTVAVGAAEMAQIVEQNPFASAAVHEPKSVHVLFTRADLDADAVARLAVAQEEARGLGSSDEVVVFGRVAYLHLPDGMARSELATRLSRGGKKATVGTIRNWRTVERLLQMSTATSRRPPPAPTPRSSCSPGCGGS